MTPIISAFNSKRENDGGRDKKNDSDLSDSGENTRDYGQSQSKSFSLTKCLYCGNELDDNSVGGFCDENCILQYSLDLKGGVK